MLTLIDHIKLHRPELREAFVRWVQQTDYRSCPELPSVQRFQVFAAPAGSDFDFFEVIEVSSWQDFERDMQGPVFASLVAGFSQLAGVVRQIVGEPLPPGYRRHG